MKLFHRMMMLTLILCLVFGLGGCTQEKSPSEPEQSSMQTVEPPEEPGTEPLTFESADLGITFDLPDSLRGHSKIMLPMSALAFCSPQTTALWAACVKGIFDISSFM